jgi:hypothetical protein
VSLFGFYSLYISEASRTMLHLTTGAKGINGPNLTSGLILMNLSIEVMSSSSKLCAKLNQNSITP